ncbi:hypothetical protein ACF082_23595 [Streptomyces lydicus]|uniref:hypothetical protein n=1 Tax=Streptomyces lydicus TaxID=47763 RepID=UPI0036FE1DB7
MARQGTATLTPPPGFPAGIPIPQQAFRNWSLEIVVENVWTSFGPYPRRRGDPRQLGP